MMKTKLMKSRFVVICLLFQFFIQFQQENLMADEIGRVNEDTGNLNQYYPAVAASASGLYVVAWCEGLDQQFNIKAQLYNQMGNKIGKNFRINDQELGSLTRVDVAMAANGLFVITWTDFLNRHIYAQRFAADGTRLGNNINVMDDMAKTAVAATADGRFLIVHVADGNYLKGHLYDVNGQKIDVMIGIAIGSDAGYPEIDCTSDGFFVFAWMKGIDENIIKSTYYDANKNEIGPTITVRQHNLLGYRASFPDIAIAEDRSYVIVWEERTSVNGNVSFQVLGKHYDKNQNQIGDVIQISPVDGVAPAITKYRSGEFFVDWSRTHIFGQHFSSDMKPIGESIRINHDTGTAGQSQPAVCWGPGGLFHVWQDYRNPDKGVDLYAAMTHVKVAQFTDVTTSSGVGDGVCVGFAFGDFNRDEILDLYIYNNGANKLFKNSGAPNFNFADVTTAAGVGNDQQGNGTAFFDYNNDGYTDLLLLNNGAKVIFKNKGDGTFTDVTTATNLTDLNNSVGCAIGDYNNDGYLDIYLVNYNAVNHLFRNSGPPDWKFTDVASTARVNANRDGQACIFWDYDNDHDQDIYVSNYMANNILYKNNGDGTFTDVGQAAGVNYGARCRGAIALDFDNDGDLDLYLTRGRYQTNQNNVLYQNNGAPAWNFTNVTTSAGVGNIGDGSLSTVGDYDNDGDLDIYVANGANHANPQNALYQNNGNGTFTDVATSEGVVNPLACSAASFVDYDNDGFLDLYTANTEGANILYKNQGTNNHWLKVKLVGKRGNHDAIGARIIITADQKKQIREVNGDNPGLHIFNNQPVHFGLGQTTNVEMMKIEWPSGGGTQIIQNLAVDQMVTIMEYAYSAGTNQIKPAIALAPDESYFIAYLDEKSQFCDVYAEQFTADGDALRYKFRVSDLSWNLSTGDIVDLKVTVDNSLIVIWSQQAQDKIYGQRYSWNGAVLGANFLVGEGYSPAVEATPDGGFIVVFTQGNWNYTICMNKYDKNGVLQQSTIKPRGQYDNFCRPAIGVAKDGAMVLAYKNNKGDTYPGSAGDALLATYYDGAGNMVSSVRVDDKPTGDHEQNLGSPAVAVAEDGSYLVFWTGGGVNRIQGKRYNKNGNLLARFDVAEYLKMTSVPVISINEYGDFVITWGDEQNGLKNIYARRYASNNQPLTNIYQINQIDQSADQIEPDVVVTSHFVHFVWQDNRIPGNGWDIRSSTEKLPLIFIDDFNDNLLSHTDWQIISRTNTYVAEKNQRLEFKVDEYIDARVESKFKLRGDFDIAVNFKVRLNSDGGNGLYFGAFDATHNYAISRHYNAGWRTKDGKYGHMYLSNFDGDYTSGRLSTAVDDTTGKLRVVRKGNQITSYFMRNGYWTELLTKTGATTDLAVSLSISTYGGTKTLAGWMDNFIITKGEIFYPPLAVEEHDFLVPLTFQLEQNFPNPFNPMTQIKYHLPESGLVKLIIYNTLGQEVRTLVQENQPAGIHQIYWDGRDDEGKLVVSGIYIYQISTGDFVYQRKMVLLK